MSSCWMVPAVFSQTCPHVQLTFPPAPGLGEEHLVLARLRQPDLRSTDFRLRPGPDGELVGAGEAVERFVDKADTGSLMELLYGRTPTPRLLSLEVERHQDLATLTPGPETAVPESRL